MTPSTERKEHAEATCSAVLSGEQVYPWMMAWAGYAKASLDARGLHCTLFDDELTMEFVPFGRQYVLGVEVWDLAREYAWRLRLEFYSSHDPNVVGQTELTLRFGAGRFDPDSELDTWSQHSMFGVGPTEPDGDDVAPARVLADQVLAQFGQWHDSKAREAFDDVALRLDDALLP